MIDPSRFPLLATPTYDEDHMRSYRKLVLGARIAVLGEDGRSLNIRNAQSSELDKQLRGTSGAKAIRSLCRTRNDLSDPEPWRVIIEAKEPQDPDHQELYRFHRAEELSCREPTRASRGKRTPVESKEESDKLLAFYEEEGTRRRTRAG